MTQNEHSYDDIINLPHPTSKKHPRMSLLSRAAQFAPFAALTGYDEAVNETARLTDRKKSLSEDEKSVLDAKLRIIESEINSDEIFVFTYFVPDIHKKGGSYVTHSGSVVKTDMDMKIIYLNDCTEIDINQITDIQSRIFEKYGI